MQTLSFREYSIKRAPATARVPKPRAPEDIAADIVFKQVDECKELVDLSYVVPPGGALLQTANPA